MSGSGVMTERRSEGCVQSGGSGALLATKPKWVDMHIVGKPIGENLPSVVSVHPK